MSAEQEASAIVVDKTVSLLFDEFNVLLRLSGAGAERLAVLLVSVLRQEKKTKGKARLTSMLRSGEPLRVFTIPQKDLETFTGAAKKYGILYSVICDRSSKDPAVPADIIVRASDAPRIQRIVERFGIGNVTLTDLRTQPGKETPEHEAGQEKEQEPENPTLAKAADGRRWRQSSDTGKMPARGTGKEGRAAGGNHAADSGRNRESNRESVAEKLDELEKQRASKGRISESETVREDPQVRSSGIAGAASRHDQRQ